MKVTWEALSTAHADIQSAWSAISQETEDLRRFVQNFAEAWTGEAANSYHMLQAQWDKTAQELENVLNLIANKLDEALTIYQETEARNRSTFAT